MRECGSRFPVSGSSNPSCPFLCRQATSCAWRTDYGRYHFGGLNVLAAKLVVHVWGAPRRPRRLESGQVRLVANFGAGFDGRGGQSVAQDAGRHGAATRTRSYAHCGLEVMSANNNNNNHHKIKRLAALASRSWQLSIPCARTLRLARAARSPALHCRRNA